MGVTLLGSNALYHGKQFVVAIDTTPKEPPVKAIKQSYRYFQSGAIARDSLLI